MVLGNVALAAPDRSLHVLYLGSVTGGGGGGFGGSRTNYVYLPGQTLAPEEIYFDHLSDLTQLTDKYLQHFDAVVQVLPDGEIDATHQQMLDSFKAAGHGLLKFPNDQRPTDTVMREAVLGGIGNKAKSE